MLVVHLQSHVYNLKKFSRSLARKASFVLLAILCNKIEKYFTHCNSFI